MDILDDIIAHKRREILDQSLYVSTAQLAAAAEAAANAAAPRHLMSQTLRQSATGIIAEFKRRSPSKGWISRHASPAIVPQAYAKAGAAALSVLTDSHYFAGSLDFLRRARRTTDAPILRKDFIVSERQMFEARAVGADAVLLIAAALSKAECRSLRELARQLGLEVLLEVHTEAELDYADCLPEMIGVNNRCLGTFTTDIAASLHLARRLPEEAVHVSESGLSDPAVILRLRDEGYRGFLIGEALMRDSRPDEALRQLIGALEKGN